MASDGTNWHKVGKTGLGREPEHRQHRGNERYALDCIETPKDGRTVPNQTDGHPHADYQTLQAVQNRQTAVQHRLA